jgi:hypothetical protein
MSKGLGKIQRAILSALADHKPQDTIQLVLTVFNIAPDPDGIRYYEQAQHAAVRRALGTLVKAGLLQEYKQQQHYRRYPHMWVIPPVDPQYAAERAASHAECLKLVQQYRRSVGLPPLRASVLIPDSTTPPAPKSQKCP